MGRREEWNDKRSEIIEPLIPEPSRRDDGKGRPRRDDREVLNGIYGFCAQEPAGRIYRVASRHTRLATGACNSGSLGRVGQMRGGLAEDLRRRGKLDLAECFIDATFVSAKKGALASARPSGARVRSSWRWQTALALLSPSTRRLLGRMKSPLLKTLSTALHRDTPERLIGDIAYDSDALDATARGTGH